MNSPCLLDLALEVLATSLTKTTSSWMTLESIEYWTPFGHFLKLRKDKILDFERCVDHFTYHSNTRSEVYVFIWMIKDGVQARKMTIKLLLSGGVQYRILPTDSRDRMRIPTNVDAKGIQILMPPLLQMKAKLFRFLEAMINLVELEIDVESDLTSGYIFGHLGIQTQMEYLRSGEILEIINSKCGLRLKHLTVKCFDFDGNRLINGEWPLLTSLDITHSESDFCDWPDFFRGITVSIPSLTKISLHPYQIKKTEDINFGHITKLELGFREVFGSDCIRFLLKSRHLSRIKSYTGPVPANLDILNKAFANLKHLRVQRSPNNNLIGRLIFKHLSRLTILTDEITEEFLKRLLVLAPHIKILDFRCYSHIHDFEDVRSKWKNLPEFSNVQVFLMNGNVVDKQVNLSR
jgi:hypothetical protein